MAGASADAPLAGDGTGAELDERPDGASARALATPAANITADNAKT
jgi:hypothetical protein